MSFLLTVYKMIIQLMTIMFLARNAHSDDLVTLKKNEKLKKTPENRKTFHIRNVFSW